MSNPSGISRRLQHCIERLQASDQEGALVNLFPAIDKTAKKRRPKKGVGARIRSFLEEEEVLISGVATGNVFARISVDGVSITDALYKFGRTPIAHEGELDPRLHFNSNGALHIGHKYWNLPTGYIVGMGMAVIVAPENRDEKVDEHLALTLFGNEIRLNELWGCKERVQEIICSKFQGPSLFQRN